MKKSVAAAFASFTFLIASAVMAAPAAHAVGEKPCAHCATSGLMMSTTGATRGSLYGVAARPCKHLVAQNVRWGQAQQSCPHCSHNA